MAKEDFCFTYYDGDAARDKAHMSRLERGAYDDIISAQRKRGHLSIDDIKKVLSKDFDACWPSMEWILLTDAEEKYYIEWVDKSLEKMRRQSEKQKENVSKRWKKDDTTVIPPYKNGINSVIPLENENENENENQDRGVQGGKELTAIEIGNTVEFVFKMKQVRLTHAEVLNYWESFLLNEQEPAYYTREKKIRHFRNWVKNQIKNGSSSTTNSNKPHKPGTSEARIAALKNWGTGTSA